MVIKLWDFNKQIYNMWGLQTAVVYQLSQRLLLFASHEYQNED